jgi:DDE superfamily endonuclease
VDFKEVYGQGLSSRELHGTKFSQYYNASTDKVMVLSFSGGGVVWVSDPYSGHASDDELIIHHYPMLAKYVPAGSIIFCDKGASHAAIAALALAAGHDWRIPPRKTTGERFSRAEVVDQATCGSARIVVENVIGAAHNRLVEGQAPT